MKQDDPQVVPILQATEDTVPFYEPDELNRLFGFERFYYDTLNAVHDYDFQYFDKLDDDVVFCDIGANHGQSINSLRLKDSFAELHSFEINPVLWPQLEKRGRAYKGQFTLHRYGISAVEAEVDFFLPVFEGQIADTLGTMSLQELKTDMIQMHLNSMAGSASETSWGVIKTKCEVKSFDGLNIKPDIVKIDVEGCEISVLQGMEKTIADCKPILLIENSDPPAFCQFLSNLGYMPMNYDSNTNHLYFGIGDRGNNTFFLHTVKILELQRLGVVVYSTYDHSNAADIAYENSKVVDFSFIPLKVSANGGLEGVKAEARSYVRTVLQSVDYLDKNPTNATHVALLYRSYLGRFPVPRELGHWKDELDAGRQTTDMLIDVFAASDEFTDRLNTFF